MIVMGRYDSFFSVSGLMLHWLSMMSNIVTCTDMLQGIMTHPAFQFTPDSSSVKLYFPCLASSVVVLSSAKLIFIFAKFEMAASATSVKELNVLKQCSNP
jgi:hypothetical protein